MYVHLQGVMLGKDRHSSLSVKGLSKIKCENYLLAVTERLVYVENKKWLAKGRII